MRIVCEQCQTTYIVPDDKIVKNVLRLTCQKCGHVITTRVDGAARGEKAPSPTLGKWQRSGTGVAGRMQNASKDSVKSLQNLRKSSEEMNDAILNNFNSMMEKS